MEGLVSVTPCDLGTLHVRENELVRAGEFADKTTLLITTILQVATESMAQTQKYPKVMVTTFTRKATREIQERLMKETCAGRYSALMDFVTNKSQLHVSTIHGILHIFLQAHGRHMGIDPGFAVVEGASEKILFKSTLRDVLLNCPEGLELLQQYDFARVCAYVRSYFYHWMASPGLQPQDHHSFLEYAHHYAGYWQQQALVLAQNIIDETSDEKWLEFANVLQKLSLVLKQADFAKARGEALSLLAENSPPRHMSKNPKVTDELAQAVKDFRGELKELEEPHWNTELWPDFIARFSQLAKVASEFSPQFLQRKIETGQFTVADLETVALRLIREFPQAAEAFRKEWQFWLVDEYQDTSPIQVEILNALIGSQPSFVVGDPQQSIYLFRGARSEVFASREKWITEQRGVVSELRKNYRSTPPLLLFFNDFFTAMSSQFRKMEPKDDVDTAVDRKAAVATFTIVEQEFNDQGELNEYLAICQHLHSLVERGVRPGQICIIGRTNRRLSELARYLARLGYPTHQHVSSGFFERRQIKDAFAILKFLANPHDDLNFLSMLRSPWMKISDPLIASAIKTHTGSLWIRLSVGELNSHPTIGFLQRLQDECRGKGYGTAFEIAMRESGLLEWCTAVDVTGRHEANLWKFLFLLKESEGRPGFNVLHFLSQGEKSVDVEEAESEADAVTSVEPDRINLMTVHGSKGLQFDHVIVPHLHLASMLSKRQGLGFDEDLKKWSIPIVSEEDNSFIYSLADKRVVEKTQAAELLEDERLLYVALTRARQTVFLSWLMPARARSPASRFRWDFSQAQGGGVDYRFNVDRGPWQEKAYPGRSRLSPTVPAKFSLQAQKNSQKRTISVTTMVEHFADQQVKSATKKESDVEVVLSRVQRAQHGVMVHRLFEILSSGSGSGSLSVAERDSLLKRWFSQDDVSDVEKALQFVESLQTPPMKTLLASGHAEWGFLSCWHNYIVEGQVDLWGEVGGHIWIIDYKTGNSRYADRAFQQLAIYGKVLAKKNPGKPISLATVYPIEQKVEVREMAKMAEFLAQVETSLLER